jgi:hypothetical protein
VSSRVEGVPDAVVHALDRLATAGFVEVDHQGTGGVNHAIDLWSRHLAVRLVGDRGQWWVEAGPVDAKERFDAQLWAACVPSSAPAPEAAGDVTADVEFFVANEAVLAAAAADVSTRDQLTALKRRRARERLGLPPE